MPVSHTRRADIIIAAVGVANYITGDMIKDGAVVIDVGVNEVLFFLSAGRIHKGISSL